MDLHGTIVGRIRRQQWLREILRSILTRIGRHEYLRARDSRSRVLHWRTKVSAEDERRAFDVLDAFGLNPYELGRPVASRPYLHAVEEVEARGLGEESPRTSS